LCFNSLSNTLVNNSNESDDDLFIWTTNIPQIWRFFIWQK
jgi:hypothetical protein